MAPARASYVLPVRWRDDAGLEDLADYLRWLAGQVQEVIVVDGSEPDAFDRHAESLDRLCTHIPPDPEPRFLMGKVDGVVTGVRAARNEAVVIADDDVRYDGPGLRRIVEELEGSDLVRPQNYFEPVPWHARLDTGRTLLNRVHSGDPVFGAGDFPGTLGVRRSAFLRCGGYDGDVMFENLELMRTIKAAGGRVSTPLDLYVRREPPTSAHFVSQRVRQAYDDFALPVRMAAFLAVAPAAGWALARRRLGALAAGTALIAGTAEAGRRRAGGTRYFPASSSLLAPVWVAERAVSVWLAVLSRVRYGGVRYGDSVIRSSATPLRKLRRSRGRLTSPVP